MPMALNVFAGMPLRAAATLAALGLLAAASPARAKEPPASSTGPEIVVRPPEAPPAPPLPAARSVVGAATKVLRVGGEGGAIVRAQTSPLGIGQGPTVPLLRGGSKDVLTPLRVHEATAVSVEELAARLPGVTSRLYSGDEHMRPSISTRGMPDNGFTEYTSVLVNGINYSSLVYGWTAISIFPYTAERTWAAEVYRGAHTVRFGPNTIGGVVNFLTWPIPEELTFRQRTTVGSNEYLSSLTQVGGTDKRTGVGFLATYVDKDGETFRFDNEFHATEAALDVIAPTSRRSWLKLSGFWWDAKHNLPLRLTKAQLDADPRTNGNPTVINWDGYAYGGDVLWHLDTCNGWFEAFSWYRMGRRELESGRPTSGPPFTTINNADSDNHNLQAGFRGEVQLSSCNRLHYGARYHQEWIPRETFTEPITGGPHTVTQDAFTRTHALAVHVDDTQTWGRLTLQAGVRLEWIPDSSAHDRVTDADKEFDMLEVLPGVSAAYQLTEELAVFGNLHRSVRPPQAFSYEFNKPDQKLDFERGTNIEAGLRWRCWKGLSGSITGWQVEYSDFIELDPILLTTTNYGGFTSRGIDLALEADFGAWSRGLCGLSAWGSVTRQESEFTVGVNDGQDTQFVPPWALAFGVRYEHVPSGVYGVFEGAWHDDAYVTPANDVKTPGYALFGARLGWRKRWCLGGADAEVDLALAVKNAFDREVWLQHNATLYVPGAPREFFGEFGIALRF